MKNYYHINEFSITIFPYRLTRGRIVALALLSALLWGFLIGVPLLLSNDPKMYEYLRKYYFGIPHAFFIFIFSITIALINARRYVVFDARHQAVYKKTVWGIKRFCSFEECGEIVDDDEKRGGYKLYKRNQRFNRGIFISPESSGDKKEFEKNVLPAIRALLSISSTGSVAYHMPYQTGNFKRFQNHTLGYELIPQKWLFGLIALAAGVIEVVLLILCLVYPAPDNDYVAQIIFLILPWPVLFFAVRPLLRKVVFDCTKRVVKIGYFGRLTIRGSFDDFVRFEVMKMYINGLYTRTKVYMNFGDYEVFLDTFFKIRGVDDLLNEARIIMNKK